MSTEWEPETVLDVFGNEHARDILVLASAKPMSAEELAEQCGLSLPTVYRRVNVLESWDLLRADTRLDADGNHYQTYETKLREVRFAVEEGGFTVDVERRHDLVDKFESFWEGLESDGGDRRG